MKEITLHIVSVDEKIKVQSVECIETEDKFKVKFGDTFYKNEANIVHGGVFHGSYFIYSTDEREIENMKKRVEERAIKYHTRNITKHKEAIKSIKGE